MQMLPVVIPEQTVANEAEFRCWSSLILPSGSLTTFLFTSSAVQQKGNDLFFIHHIAAEFTPQLSSALLLLYILN